MNRVRAWVFAAVKGGVGKTTLANAVALHRARSGGRVLVLELDLLGTSVCDALQLRAPQRRVLGEGQIDLVEAGAHPFLTLDQTWSAMSARMRTQLRPAGVPFLNDAVVHDFQGFTDDVWLPGLAWCREPDDRICWLPTSPSPHDMRVAAGWLRHSDPAPMITRLVRLVEMAPVMDPHLTDLVFDLPPGLYGFADLLLGALAQVAAAGRTANWDVRRLLVTTPDRQDLLSTARAWLDLQAESERFIPVLNRATEHQRRDCEALLLERMPVLRALGFSDRLQRVGLHPSTLGSWFQGGAFGDKLLPEEVGRLGTEGR